MSTKTFDDFNERQVPRQFLPGSWEPMWGVEEERPLALGNFADSMVPLHGYRHAVDLRSDNELWLGGKKEMRDTGIYAGPGLWFNRATGTSTFGWLTTNWQVSTTGPIAAKPTRGACHW